ncbi:MAG: hypothetical protein AUI36_34285 [Cyanobacteria bacterium 13_1_40CM_2_61_4]|nr:MAG: hypothetical protein AUI36_34285 [Cyanobacteria bacterium 13_1_40CM_2_61_4]
MIRDFLVIVFLSIPPPYQKQPILAILPFGQSAPYSNRTITGWGVKQPLHGTALFLPAYGLAIL